MHLTVTEFLLLKSLAERPGHVKNRDQLMDAAYGETIYVDDRTIDSHIKRVRRKFREVDGEFEQIETLYGIGYRYRDRLRASPLRSSSPGKAGEVPPSGAEGSWAARQI